MAGLRPTKGCYIAGDGVVPLSTTRDTPGDTNCLQVFKLSAATHDHYGLGKLVRLMQSVRLIWTSLLVSAWARCAGVMARSVSDIAMFNKIFSTCNSTLPSVNLSGYRIGYATNWWANLGPEVICCPCMVSSYSISKQSRPQRDK